MEARGVWFFKILSLFSSLQRDYHVRNILMFTVKSVCRGHFTLTKTLRIRRSAIFVRSRSHGSVGQFFVAIAGSVHLASGAPFGRGNVVIVHHGRRYMER